MRPVGHVIVHPMPALDRWIVEQQIGLGGDEQVETVPRPFEMATGPTPCEGEGPQVNRGVSRRVQLFCRPSITIRTTPAARTSTGGRRHLSLIVMVSLATNGFQF